jgi:hypothetical protein
VLSFDRRRLMTLAALDTHAIVKDLRAAGFNEEQAEAVTRVVRQAQDMDLSALATKTDLAETKAEILKWMVSVIGIQTIVIIGAVLALLHSSGR